MTQATNDKTPFDGFYAGKKVFITGHTGFKGAWLAAWLLRLGADVTGYALPPNTNPSLFKASGLARRVKNLSGDVRDLPRLQKAVRAAKPDVIFHLAAQPLVFLSYQNPFETVSTNVAGTANILQATRALQKPCALVNVTSDKVYFNPETGLPLKETDPLGGYDPYSASKAMAEQVTACWRDVLGFSSCATARAGNVIGGGDWARDRLLPGLISALRGGKPACLRRPDAVRPWQYILEPLQGYLLLGAALYQSPEKFAGAWNFGPAPKDCLTVRELAEEVLKSAGKGSLVMRPESGGKEAALLRLNSAKARRGLKWRPVYDARQAARRALQWYRRFYAGENAAQLVEEEIAAYEAALTRRA